MSIKPRIPIKVKVESCCELKGELVRIFAPMTVDFISSKLPLEGPLAKTSYSVYFPCNISKGAEKVVTTLKPKDITYWPAADAICIVTSESPAPAQMVKIGRLLEDASTLNSAKKGSKVILERM